MNDPTAEQHWAVAMSETVCVAGCICIFCTRRSETSAEGDHTRTTPRSRPRRHIRRSLPSTTSIMEVLYPSSYLGTPSFPNPPSYVLGDAHPSTAQGDSREHTERTPPISTAAAGGTLVPSDPLVEVPSLTGVPSSGGPFGRIPPAEPNPPVVGLGIDVLGEAEPPPAYSRFDESRWTGDTGSGCSRSQESSRRHDADGRKQGPVLTNYAHGLATTYEDSSRSARTPATAHDLARHATLPRDIGHVSPSLRTC